jgi:hypothetical protein
MQIKTMTRKATWVVALTGLAVPLLAGQMSQDERAELERLEQEVQRLRLENAELRELQMETQRAEFEGLTEQLGMIIEEMIDPGVDGERVMVNVAGMEEFGMALERSIEIGFRATEDDVSPEERAELRDQFEEIGEEMEWIGEMMGEDAEGVIGVRPEMLGEMMEVVEQIVRRSVEGIAVREEIRREGQEQEIRELAEKGVGAPPVEEPMVREMDVQPREPGDFVWRYRQLMERITDPGVDKDVVAVNEAAMEEWAMLTVNLLQLGEAAMSPDVDDEGRDALRVEFEQERERFMRVREQLEQERGQYIGMSTEHFQELNELIGQMLATVTLNRQAPVQRDFPRPPMPMPGPRMEPIMVQDGDHLFILRGNRVFKILKSRFELMSEMVLPSGPGPVRDFPGGMAPSPQRAEGNSG